MAYIRGDTRYKQCAYNVDEYSFGKNTPASNKNVVNLKTELRAGIMFQFTNSVNIVHAQFKRCKMFQCVDGFRDPSN